MLEEDIHFYFYLRKSQRITAVTMMHPLGTIMFNAISVAK